MIRRILALIVVTLFVSACGGDASTPNQSAASRKVTVMLDWTPNTNHNGIYLAERKGYYDRVGLDVTILQPGEQGSLPALGSGDADFVVTMQEDLIPARAAGVPAVSLAGIVSTNTSSLMSLSATNITRPKDLEGKSYGGYGGQLERQLVSSLVKCDGGDPTKVNFVDVGNANYRAGLELKQYDFVWVFDGWDVLRLRQDGVGVSTIAFADHFDCIPDWYTPLLATSEKNIADDPDLVRDFTQATQSGYQDAISDPAGASGALLAGAPELDPRLVKDSSAYLARFYAKSGQPWGVQDRDTWARFEQFLRTAGLTSTPVEVDKAFTNAFLSRT